ncbi:MAG: GTPase Era [Ardenticatenaceae bacterium]|nr:GTPase Era [Ardenticatenaceae bacterium]MCB8949713.1 GTPase Era [Ardenticatenaceae bacterium]
MNESTSNPTGYDTSDDHRSGFVAVIGRPNVGKSTLINALLQEKINIVSPKPQTTRSRQLGILTTADFQIVFMDTPGLMQPRHKLDEFMVETAVESLNEADVVLWLVDGSEPIGPGDKAIAEMVAQVDETIPVVLAINKSDVTAPENVMPHTEAYRALAPEAAWIFFSAQEGNGRSDLLNLIVQALPEGPRYYPADQITDIYVRDMAAEFIREQVMLQLRDEIPYGVAVQVDQFKERDNGVTYIGANIFVERDNHKAIVIGAKGSQLRKIGAAARKELETLVDGKVFLELWVKVEPKWRHNERALKRLGYSKPE